MHFSIDHLTRYTYDRPVTLGPQTLRLRPRADGAVRERTYRLSVSPEPAARDERLDAEGNRVAVLHFDAPLTELRIRSACEVETLGGACSQARGPGRQRLPMRYAPEDDARLRRYRLASPAAPGAAALAERLATAAGHEAEGFLSALTRWLHAEIAHEVRESGAALTPDQTLARRRGACRDVTLLFMAACRAQGMAVRFVSGYQARAEHGGARRYLHAWPEVYVPGGGWCGFDPTHGERVADAHVPVAAACEPAAAAPLEGVFFGAGPVRSRLDFELLIRADGGDS